MTRTLTVLALLLSSLPASATAEPDAERVRWGLNYYKGKFVPGGSFRAIGWAFEPATGTTVPLEIQLDGGRRGDVLMGGYRPDVPEAIPGAPLFSGFQATVSLRGVVPGPHWVQIFARPTSGERLEIVSIPLQVHAEPGTPLGARRLLTPVLFLRTGLFVAWLTFLGAGIGVWFLRHPLLTPSAGLGLAASALAIEWGVFAGVKPAATADAATLGAALSLGLAAATGRLRRLRLSRVSAVTLVGACLLAAGAFLPIVSHGAGAVLGTITDAPWELSYAEGIARWNGQIPEDVAGHWRRLPVEWRNLDFRGGPPYLFAAVAGALGLPAHEVYSPVLLGAATVVVFSIGALAGRLLPGHPLLQGLAVSLAAASPVLVSEIYHQHAAVTLSAALFATFLLHLLALVRGRRPSSLIPAALTVAALPTLYPEIAPLVALAGLAGVTVSGRRAGRTLGRLLLVAAIAAAANPIALARAARFGWNLNSAAPLSSPPERLLFGDTHHFPSLSVAAGLRPYHRDWPRPGSPTRRAIEWTAVVLAAATALFTMARLSRRAVATLIVLLLPPLLLLGLNRALSFPYGYSKALLHAAVLSGTGLAVLVASALGKTDRLPTRIRRLGVAVAFATSLLVLGLSSASAADVMLRAYRAVPGYDPAWPTLLDLARGLDRRFLVVTDEAESFRLEWVRHFLGEHAVYSRGEPRKPEHAGRPALLLVDKRDRLPAPAPLRQNSLFALVPAPAASSEGSASPE